MQTENFKPLFCLCNFCSNIYVKNSLSIFSTRTILGIGEKVKVLQCMEIGGIYKMSTKTDLIIKSPNQTID